MPLSEGRLNAAGELECPYHGWTFDGQGRCTAIPQASDGSQPSDRRSSCRAYATATGQGMLFVFAGAPEAAAAVPLPLVPVLEETEAGWLVQDTFRDLPYDALTLLENVLDVSHVPFTHHATVGRRETAGPVDLRLEQAGPGGFSGVWEEGPRRGKLGSQFTTFLAPGLMWHDLTARGFARILTVVYATPTRPGECRLFARFPFQFESPWPGRLLRLRPQWLQHIGNHTVLEDDQIFLHWQERVLEARGGSAALSRACHLATGADAYVKALRDWVVRGAGEPFPDQPLPPRLGRTRAGGALREPHPPLPQLLRCPAPDPALAATAGPPGLAGPAGDRLVPHPAGADSRGPGGGGRGRRVLEARAVGAPAADGQRPAPPQPAAERCLSRCAPRECRSGGWWRPATGAGASSPRPAGGRRRPTAPCRGRSGG